MPELLIYKSSTEPPSEIAHQVRSLLLAEWPNPEGEENEETLTNPALHPTYFILAEENQLLSYARTIWAGVTHQGQPLKLYGLGDVITVPKYRSQGYASRIIQAATTHIESDPEADAAVLLTEPNLEELYRRSGWEHIPKLRVITNEEEYKISPTIPMMLFLSATAHTLRERFASEPLVLPGAEW